MKRRVPGRLTPPSRPRTFRKLALGASLPGEAWQSRVARACVLAAALATLMLQPGRPGAAQAQQPDGPEPTEPDDLSEVVESVNRLLDSTRAEAAAKLTQKDYPGALRALQRAYELDPDEPQVVISLAELLALLGNRERAETLYRQALTLAPERADPYLGLARLLSEQAGSSGGSDEGRLTEAAELLARARELGGNDPSVLLLQARIAVARGRFEDAERAYGAYQAEHKVDDALRLELGDFYRDFDQPERALAVYRQVAGAQALRTAAQRIFELEVDREARRYGLHPRAATVSPEVRALLSRARSQVRQGRDREAEQLLERALSLAPAFAPAHAELGRLLHARGEGRNAELAYLRALAIDNGLHEAHQGLGELYLARGGPEAATQAALFLERALNLRPDVSELHLRLAHALRTAGDLPRALLHVERYLADSAKGAGHKEALELRALLRAALGTAEGEQAVIAGAGEAPPNGADQSLARARAQLSRGAVDAALLELRKLVEREPSRAHSREARILEARILRAAGKHAEAAGVLRELLSKGWADAAAHVQLGLILLSESKPQQAREHLLEAERLGHDESSFHLARLDMDALKGSLWGDVAAVLTLLRTRERLSGFVATATTPYHEEARLLLNEVESRLRLLALVAAALLLALVGGVLWWRNRRYGGGDLWDLLERAPDAVPELSRILSAIAHEVLKHNTLMLGGLCAQLAGGQAVGETANTLERALFGPDGNGGAARRLEAYVDQLRQLGRAHGLRLNLKHRDIAIGALTEGFTILRALRGRLRRIDQAGSLSRRRSLARLQQAATLLNEEAEQAVRALLDETRVLEVDEALVREIFERTSKEPALARYPIEALEIAEDAELPIALSLPRQAFDDIIANLFRNALQASARESGGKPLCVGLTVRRKADLITGLQQAVLSIQDRGSAALSRQQLRARAIETGLGLTADLVTRYDGSLDVSTNQPGWTKAVVLILPCTDDA